MMTLSNQHKAVPLVAHYRRYAPLYRAVILRAVEI